MSMHTHTHTNTRGVHVLAIKKKKKEKKNHKSLILSDYLHYHITTIKYRKKNKIILTLRNGFLIHFLRNSSSKM